MSRFYANVDAGSASSSSDNEDRTPRSSSESESDDSLVEFQRDEEEDVDSEQQESEEFSDDSYVEFQRDEEESENDEGSQESSDDSYVEFQRDEEESENEEGSQESSDDSYVEFQRDEKDPDEESQDEGSQESSDDSYVEFQRDEESSSDAESESESDESGNHDDDGTDSDDSFVVEFAEDPVQKTKDPEPEKEPKPSTSTAQDSCKQLDPESGVETFEGSSPLKPEASTPLPSPIAPSGKQPMAIQPDRFADHCLVQNRSDLSSDYSDSEPLDPRDFYSESHLRRTSDEEGDEEDEEDEEDYEGIASDNDDDKPEPPSIKKLVVDMDPEQAKECKQKFLDASAKYKNRVLLESGVALMKQKRRTEALRLWSRCVMNKHAWFNMAVAFEAGEYSDNSTQPDHTQAQRYFRKAAKLDHPLAIYNLALYYLYGKGAQKKDVDMAHVLLTKAKAMGVEPAIRFYDEVRRQTVVEEKRVLKEKKAERERVEAEARAKAKRA